MEISLKQKEIQDALIEFINNQGIDLTGKQVVVTLTAGRGANGHSAKIEIMPLEENVDKETGSDMPGSDESQQAIEFKFIK